MDKYVITIARGFGSGGRTIGKMLSENLGIAYYDKDLIKLASEESGINESLFGEADEKVKNTLFKKRAVYKNAIIPPDSSDFVSNDNLFNFQAKIIKDLADKESCVIVGRCADYVLRERKNVIKVFVYADIKACIKNVMSIYSCEEREAMKLIEKIDKTRSTYYKYYVGREWDNARNYDLCLNSSELGFEKCVEIIKDYIKIKND